MKIKLISLIVLSVLFSCSQPIPRKPITIKTTTFLKKSISFNKSLNETEEKIFKNLIKKDSLNKYVSSPSGFWFTHNYKSSNNYFPKIGDQVFYTYEVLDVAKNQIYTVEEIGNQTYLVDKQELVEGLRNGLKLMNEGDIVTFLFPSHKIFGYLGDENKIGINQPLIYKVQLNKINKKNEIN
jgi:gliding motility-associated peptidyl-prolyl isomerase